MTPSDAPLIIEPPYLSRAAIRACADELYAAYLCPATARRLARRGWTFEDVYDEVLYPDYGFTVRSDLDLGAGPDASKTLGLYEAVENAICIDRALHGDPRETFTRWHEAGHAVLHGQWIRDRVAGGAREYVLADTQETLAPGGSWWDWQANTFASYAAAPTRFLDWALRETYGLHGRLVFPGPAKYWLQPGGRSQSIYVATFEDLCIWIAGHIQHLFDGLSQQALGIRVADSRWLENRAPAYATARAGSSLADVMRELRPDRPTLPRSARPPYRDFPGEGPRRHLRRGTLVASAVTR